MIRTQPYQPGSRLGRSFMLNPDMERAAKAKHLDTIQSFAQRELGPDDVAVRGMLLCNSQRDYYYSRFTREALDEVAEMVPGAPVMVGHDYRGVPIGRFFDSRVVRIESDAPKRDQYWVEALYYAPKDDQGKAFIERVDLGIWREVSIGFRLASAPCSVCSKAIWACEHIPGEIYAKKGVCEWGMEGITSVLEGSQVFRGGQKDTSQFIPDGYATAEGAKVRSAFVEGTNDFDSRLIVSAKRANAAAYEPFGVSVEEFLASSNGQRAMGFGAMFGKRGERGSTQAIVCAKSRFSTRSRAARYVRDLDFRADKMKDAGVEYVFEQFAESAGESGTFRSIALDEGVSAKTCRVRASEVSDETEREIALDAEDRTAESTGDESVESWLARA